MRRVALGKGRPGEAQRVALAPWHCVLSCTRCHLCRPRIGFQFCVCPGSNAMVQLLLPLPVPETLGWGYSQPWCLPGGGCRGCRSAEPAGRAPTPLCSPGWSRCAGGQWPPVDRGLRCR